MGVRRCLARSLTSLALLRTPKSANGPRSNSFRLLPLHNQLPTGTEDSASPLTTPDMVRSGRVLPTSVKSPLNLAFRHPLLYNNYDLQLKSGKAMVEIIMQYNNIVTGTFIKRPNRFIAHVLIDGRETVCHVKNTGRLREFLLPGASLLLEFHPDAALQGRKTAYSVIGVYKDNAGFEHKRLLINMDSQAPNQAAAEWLAGGGLASCTKGTPQLSARPMPAEPEMLSSAF